MTKKDYEQFARMFKDFNPEDHPKPAGVYTCADVFELARQTASIFEADNPRFDRRRFLLACGMHADDVAKGL